MCYCVRRSAIPSSKHKFQGELNQPRVVDRTIHRSKACRLKEGLWRAKLRMVEEVEELSAELETHPFGRTEGCSLEYGEIEIDDALLTQAGIYTRLVAKDKGIGLGETGSVEPLIQPGLGTAGSLGLAAGNAIWAGACVE